MNLLVKEIRHSPMLCLLALAAAVLIIAKLVPEAHTLLFVLSVLAIVPLAALLGHATESVAQRIGDTIGGLLNATLGNLTELVIALAALGAGEYDLVKGSIAGAIVTNTLFMLGALGSAAQIALFVAPVLVLLSYAVGPMPMDLQFWLGAVIMVFLATLVAAFTTNSGHSAWFVGVLLLLVYAIFAMTQYWWPPQGQLT